MRLIGVDVGGTKTAVVALEGGVLSEIDTTPTPTDSTEALLDHLAERIRAQGPADAVGVAVPSVIDWAAGAARFSVNIPLAGVALRSELGGRLDGMAVHVDNDATCAALAEALGDDGTPLVQHLVMVTVGTGVGGGLVIGGRVYRGATGAAAELGHMIVAADLRDGAPRAHRFPHPDSLEEAASGGALGALAGERGLGDGRAAVEAARRGEQAAIEVLRIAGERLGVGIANLINVLDPDVVAVGGGVSQAGDLLLEPARAAARRLVLTGVGTRTEIRAARHGEDAGVRGAALLAMQELGEVEST
ncbi:MAG: ROK family protein [Solirubrobacterales bacterium]|nr:ROK family protein [Solirubrobacterales bacterium]